MKGVTFYLNKVFLLIDLEKPPRTNYFTIILQDMTKYGSDQLHKALLKMQLKSSFCNATQTSYM